MNFEKSVKIDLCRFEWMNMYVFLKDIKGKVSEFKDKFCEN